MKLCCMASDGFVAYSKTEDIYVDIENDFETRFDVSNYELQKIATEKKSKSFWINER